jgi:hypothetical protein
MVFAGPELRGRVKPSTPDEGVVGDADARLRNSPRKRNRLPEKLYSRSSPAAVDESLTEASDSENVSNPSTLGKNRNS